jgi:hypothetical protein
MLQPIGLLLLLYALLANDENRWHIATANWKDALVDQVSIEHADRQRRLREISARYIVDVDADRRLPEGRNLPQLQSPE